MKRNNRSFWHSVFISFHECEILSVTLREGHRLRVFENRVLRRIFGPKRGEVMGGWRRKNA
jgi:hypothetical protein